MRFSAAKAQSSTIQGPGAVADMTMSAGAPWKMS
jgi:hypothetical protein